MSSVFSCSLIHHLPYYGKAEFRTCAGQRSTFFLQAKSSRFAPGKADIVAMSPIWKPNATKIALGQVPAKKGKKPIYLQTGWAELMLEKLYSGSELEISQKAWYQQNKDDVTRLELTPIGFREAYDRYLSCLTGLLPANFYQMRRSAIYFPPGEIEKIPTREIAKLDKILQIVKHDPTVRAFFVDGHTDSDGDRTENLALSKVRAELVADYLKRRGVQEDWITLRWHGERYPVTSNSSVAGRSKNRRVSVRIEKVEEIEVLSLADDQSADQEP